jgi:hypothetical protein
MSSHNHIICEMILIVDNMTGRSGSVNMFDKLDSQSSYRACSARLREHIFRCGIRGIVIM